jgi:hypothetical protein
MHHRPAKRPLPAVLSTALGHGRHRPRRIPRHLVAAVLALVAAVLAALLPGPSGSEDGATALALDSAGHRHEAPDAARRATPADQAPGGEGATTSPAVDAGDAAATTTADADTLPAPEDAAGAGDAAAATTADAGTTTRGWGPDRPGHRGDHARQEPQQAAVANPNCTLAVPADPTSAAGLATPYRLVATDRRAGACHEANPDQSAFVEAAIIDPTTGDLSIYHPLVIDAGTDPAATPVPVSLPAGAVVGVWFGYNGDTLTLAGPGASDCVNGLRGSPFGQFAYCNAPAFFDAVHAAIGAGKLAVPALGTARDGLPCPTVRDFSVVDQDQSDNLATVYRVVDGRMAQDTAAARGGEKLTNGSDNGLLARSIDPALGCTPFQAPDLTDGGRPTPALALNEISAAVNTPAARAALIPTSDPMTQVDGRPSREKTDLFRAGVDQPPLPAGQDPQAYCRGIVEDGQARLRRDARFFSAAPAPAADAANLQQFLADRLENTLVELGCRQGGD